MSQETQTVLSYPEYLKVDRNMPYTAYLQGMVEDEVITEEEAQEWVRKNPPRHLVVGYTYDDIEVKKEEGETSHSTKVVYAKITNGSWTSRDACVDWAWRHGAEGVRVVPEKMWPLNGYFLTDEQWESLKEGKMV